MYFNFNSFGKIVKNIYNNNNWLSTKAVNNLYSYYLLFSQDINQNEPRIQLFELINYYICMQLMLPLSCFKNNKAIHAEIQNIYYDWSHKLQLN